MDINVLSENIDDWMRWSREPERVLTTFSRAHRQTVMPQVYSRMSMRNNDDKLSRSVAAIVQMQRHAPSPALKVQEMVIFMQLNVLDLDLI